MSAPGPVRRAPTGKDDWETPRGLFELCEDYWGPHTLDAAANTQNHKCARWFGPGGEEPDGLEADWGQARVWLNPPYSEVRKWVHKAELAAVRGAHATLLVPNATETAWFSELFHMAKEILFLVGRVSFVAPDGSRGSNTGGSVIAVIRPLIAPFGNPAVGMWNWKGEID